MRPKRKFYVEFRRMVGNRTLEIRISPDSSEVHSPDIIVTARTYKWACIKAFIELFNDEQELHDEQGELF